MPASPKHVVRRTQDFYETPYWCTRALLDNFEPITNSRILEPCAGEGAISKEIMKAHPDTQLMQVEIQNKMKDLHFYGDVNIADFLSDDVDKILKIFDPHYIITNPPFSLAQPFIEKCLTEFNSCITFMLLPLSFLGSAERHEFWKQHRPSALFILSDRPSFTGEGTDSSVYAWYCWCDANVYSGVYFLKNSCKTKYERDRTIKVYENAGLKDYISKSNRDINYYNLKTNKISYQLIYKKFIKDNSYWEDIYRNF